MRALMIFDTMTGYGHATVMSYEFMIIVITLSKNDDMKA